MQELLFARGIDVTYEAIVNGAANLDRSMPIDCGAVGLGPGINGTWMKCF